MGNATVPQNERKISPGKTEPGGVEHNISMGSDGEDFTPGPKLWRSEIREPAVTMSNDLLTQSDTDSQAAAKQNGSELDVTFGIPIEEKPIWADLYESIRDIFFPPKLPPLELTSTPIPVPDRMAVKRNPLAVGISTTLNVGIVVALIFIGVKNYIAKTKPVEVVTPVDLTDFKAPKKDTMAGGGGGSPDKSPAIQGKIPPRMTQPTIAPKIAQPQLPSIDVQRDIVIPDDSKMPNFGMANSTNVRLASGGNGSGMGLGNGNGNGYGNGTGGNIGGGLYRIGSGVSAPVPLNTVEAEFSDEARKAKYQGIVTVEIIVDAQGNPQNPRVVRPLGMGLDEKAIEAVRKYRFKPAMKDGKPVPVKISVEINFRLY
jgi:protein TonB